MRKNSKLGIVAISLILCVAAVSPIYGKTLNEINEERTQVKNELSELEESISKQKAAVDEIQKKVEAKEKEIEKTKEDIAATQGQIQQIKDNISKQKDGLGKRLRTMYKSGTVGFVDVILGSSDITEFLSNINLLQRIYEGDQKLLETLKQEHKKMKEKEASLKELESSLKAAKEDLDKDKKEAKKKQDAMEGEVNSLQSKLESLNADAEALTAVIQAQTQKPSESAGETSSVVSGGTGQLSWPASGPITSPFGGRIHPITGRWIGHTGIDIGVPYGVPVCAADSGKVILASWYGGYGNAVVIDHGNGISTLYGHNSSLAVSVGQSVSKGEVVAYCGSTGMSTGPHVHFEVRVNGTPVDPLGYL